MQKVQLLHALVSESVVMPREYRPDMDHCFLLDLWITSQLVQGELHGGRGGLEACYEEQEGLSHNLVERHSLCLRRWVVVHLQKKVHKVVPGLRILSSVLHRTPHQIHVEFIKTLI